MPIYDYLCANCGQLTEVIHGIDAPGPRFCPNCGAEGTLRKSFAPPAVHFKGSGWAKKDRSTSGSKAKTKEPTPAEGEARTASGAATESRDGGTTASTGGTAADKPGSGSKGAASSAPKAEG